jgi:arylsulfatase A-like enzyme
VVGGKLALRKSRFFDQRQLAALRQRQIAAVKYLDTVFEELFDLLPNNSYVTITADHGELFGEDGYFGHGPIVHDKVLEVPFIEGKLR